MDDSHVTKICMGKNIEFIRWIHEFSVTRNPWIFQETEFVYLFFCTVDVLITNFIFADKIHRFLVTEFVNLSDEFDRSHAKSVSAFYVLLFSFLLLEFRFTIAI